MTRWFVDRKYTATFSLGLATLIGIAALSYASVLRLQTTTQEVKRTQQVLEQIGKLQSHVETAETGQQGYLLTRNPRYLKRYQTAIATIDSEIDQLAQQTADNPVQQQAIAELRPLVTAKLAELQQTIARRQDQNDAIDLRIVIANRNIELMGQVRAITAQMQQEELRLLDLRSQAERLSVHQADVLIVAGALLEIWVLTVIVRRLNSDVHQKTKEIRDRQQAEEALRLSEHRFQVALKDSAIVVFNQDVNLRYTWVYNVLPEYEARGIIGKLDQDLLDPKTAEQRTILKQRVLETGVRVHEEIAVKVGAGIRHYDLTIEPLRNTTGSIVGITGISVDVSDRKYSEEQLKLALAEKEILLKEIHHRVKNNLQIISGLLQLQGGTTPDLQVRNLLRDVQNRVESMSLIHKELYSFSDLGQLDIVNYIHNLTTHLLISYQITPGRIDLKTQIKPIALSLDQAIPCGLIINELVSNSLKYAFPDDRAGEICVALRMSSETLVELLVQDTGVGISTGLNLATTETLGLSLVYALATEQLEGTVTFDTSQGTLYKIEFPLFNLVEGQNLDGCS